MSVLGRDELVMDGDIVMLSGDQATVSGIANLKQALYHRLLTGQGELPYHPDYGSNLHRLTGKTMTPSNRTAITNEVRQCILQDPRVEKVISVDLQLINKGILVTATIGAVDVPEPINLVYPFQGVDSGVSI